MNFLHDSINFAIFYELLQTFLDKEYIRQCIKIRKIKEKNRYIFLIFQFQSPLVIFKSDLLKKEENNRVIFRFRSLIENLKNLGCKSFDWELHFLALSGGMRKKKAIKQYIPVSSFDNFCPFGGIAWNNLGKISIDYVCLF